MIKVGLVVGTFTGGGIGIVVDSLVKETKRLGIEYTIVTKTALSKTDSAKIIEHPAFSKRMAEALKKFDVVHVMGGSTLVVDALRSRKPTVFTFQGQSPPALHGGPVKNAKAYAIEMLYKATMGKFDVVTCAAKFGQQDIARRYGVTKSIWIPNGVDRMMFHKEKSAAVDKIRRKYGTPLFLGVGNLYPVKGWEETLDWFEGYLKNGNKANLVIAGDGILEKPMQKRIDASNMLGHVHLLGKVPYGELNKYYNASDAYLSGSPYEGFCLPAIEALACGKPLCVRKRGAMIEHAIDSGCGMVFEDAKSFERAANGVLRMKPADVERKAEKYLKPFSWRKAAEQYAKIYKQLA
jgi:glycosyltransferase involved in cell wall biosynthesis